MNKPVLAILLTTIVAQPVLSVENVIEAISSGTTKGDIRLRFEDVNTDAQDASAITVRTRLGYTTDSYENFSITLEFEDVRTALGEDEFSVPQTGFNTSRYAVIPDPEVTEVEQAYLQYKNAVVTARVGRQVVTLDGHRFIGHVGWRQDRQTFDAARVQLTPLDGLTVDLSYLYKRNRIFAETLDADSNDFLFNLSYETPIGKVAGYSYLLDDERLDRQSDTYGASFSGKTKLDTVSILYTAEFAAQEVTEGGADFKPEYLFLEGGVSFSGFNVKLGYEVLGSDDGLASFTTPLATLHKFNGWADIFVGGTFTSEAMPLGLVDTYVSIGTKVAGVQLAAIFHDYESDEDSLEYGSEINLVATTKFGKNYNAGIKYASYESDGFSVDTDKLWVWLGLSF